MRTLIKIVISLIILVVAGLIALPFFIDPNDYKQQISDQVEKATGRTLTLEGDIGLSVFPWVALELGPLSLSNAKGFEAENFVAVETTAIRIKLMPLLKKQLVMDTIVLDGLTLNLEKNKVGNTNWDDLTGDSKANEEKPADAASSEKPALASINIDGVKVTNANIVWQDATTSQHYTISNFNLVTGSLTPGKPSTLNMDFDLTSINPQLKAQISLDSDLMVDLEKQIYSLTGLNFTVNAEGESLALPKTDIVITADIVANMEQQTVTLSQLAIQIQDLLINGDIKASKILSDTPDIAGNLTVNPFNLRQLANKLAIELPAMADSSTLELVTLTTSFTASNTQFNAQNLEVTLDQTKLTGQLGVTNFADPAINFKLVLDEIDLDRYLPPAANKQAEPNAKPASAKAGDDKLPLEALRGINAKGTFDIGRLKISGTHSEKINVTINANKGLIKLNPLSANMYQGQYQGNVNLDARGNTLKLSLNESLTGVQVEPLLKDLNGSDKLSGTVNAQAKLTGNGATVDQIKATLSGSGNFSFTDGSIKGVNIAESIRKAKAALGGNTITSNEPVKTDFSSLTGSFTATNGVINNQDLLVKSPLLRIDGAGKIDLPKESIDYRLKVSIVGSITGQGGDDLADLKGLTIPVNISGSFDNPQPSVDLASLFKDRAIQEVKDKVADKLKDQLGGDLGGLLGTEKSETAPAEATDNKASEETKPVEPAKSAEDQAKDALKDKLKGLF